MRAITSSFAALRSGGTSGPASLRRVLSRPPKVGRSIIATIRTSDFCHGPASLARGRRTCAGGWLAATAADLPRWDVILARLSPLRSASPFTRASLPIMSPTQTPPVRCDAHDCCPWQAPPFGLHPILRGSAAGGCFLEAHCCGSWSLRPDGSTPCLLPTPPRGDAVGTVFGGEQSNSTDGTCTRVDARFTGAPRRDS